MKDDTRSHKRRRKLILQTIVFTAIMIIPVLLRWTVDVDSQPGLWGLLGLMGLGMLLAICIG